MVLKKKYLRLDSLVAYLQTERDGDEIFLRYNSETIAPQDTKYIKMTKDPAPLNIEIELSADQKWVELELWDYDHFSPNDALGKFKLLVDQVSQDFTAELVRSKESDARYVLNWSVIERQNTKATKSQK
ncbi:MAG TPA: hypothetical protein VIQ51_17670 [Chryseosolibacter sp.]